MNYKDNSIFFRNTNYLQNCSFLREKERFFKRIGAKNTLKRVLSERIGSILEESVAAIISCGIFYEKVKSFRPRII